MFHWMDETVYKELHQMNLNIFKGNANFPSVSKECIDMYDGPGGEMRDWEKACPT